MHLECAVGNMGDGGGECAWLLDKVARTEISIKKICRRSCHQVSHIISKMRIKNHLKNRR